MDPALQEVLRHGADDDTVAAIIRIAPGQEPPAHVRVVARFGDVATVRIRRGDVTEAYASDSIVSFKAMRWLMPEPSRVARNAQLVSMAGDVRRSPEWPRGRGIVLAALDWGVDFTHPDFRHADGTTRLIGLWDQGAAYNPAIPNRYRYGRTFDAAAINAALRAADPFAALGYDARRSDRGAGTHGTQVLSIAGGNGRSGGPQGVAPEARLLFVHMGTSAGAAGPRPLTDSAAVLEALDYIHRSAGSSPACINMSMGTHGGPHDGTTLVERGIDAFVTTLPNRIVVQSTGNYFQRRTHASGRLAAGQQVRLPVVIDADDTTANDVEVWYPGADELMVSVESPDGRVLARAALGDTALVNDGSAEIGRLYHRRRDPNNGDHHIQLRLDAPAAVGRWTVVLRARRVVDGRYHSWIERDSRCAPCQSKFPASHAVRYSTTGSICNGRESIVVGAYDARHPDFPLGRFSSAGPTRDGRGKPDVIAPGVRILSARSTPRDASAPLLTRVSGTSMAAPHVTGAAALLCEAAGTPLTCARVRSLLRQTSDAHPTHSQLDGHRVGAGRLNIASALRALRAPPQTPSPPALPPRETAMETLPNEATDPATAPAAVTSETHDEAVEIDAADSADLEGEHNQRRRNRGPIIAPIIGAGGLGAAVIAPIGGTAIIAPLGPFGQPPSPQVVVNAGAPVAGANAACPCATTGGVAVASAEPTLAPESEYSDASDEQWQTMPEDHDEAADSLLQEQAFQESAWEDAVGEFNTYPDASPMEYDELAEASISDHPTQSVAELLRDILARAGWTGPGADDPSARNALGHGAIAARLFDHFAGRRRVLPTTITRRFEVVALPGSPATGLRAGDWMLRRGEGGLAHLSVIAAPDPWPAAYLIEHGWQVENRRPGGFVQVIDPAHGGQLRRHRFARRLCDGAQRILPDTLIVRPLRPNIGEFNAESESEPGGGVDGRWIQQALNEILGLSLTVDGIVGNQTRSAIRTFQSLHGLTPDGIVGVRTEAALRNALRNDLQPGGSGAAGGAVSGVRTGPACTTLDTFAQGRADLTPTHHTLLIALARRIQRERIREVNIVGFASSEGDSASNLALGQRRADAVARGLRDTLERMLPGSSTGVRMNTSSRGEDDQVAAGNAERNRRVEVCLRLPVAPRPPRPIPPVVPPPPQTRTRLFRVTGKSFIARIGSRSGTLNCGLTIGPITVPGSGTAADVALRVFAAATDVAFSENPTHDRRFVAPPPENKGYRLFSQGGIEAEFQGTNLVNVRLRGGLQVDAGKECAPGTSACLTAPPLIIDRPFSTRRTGPSTIQFRWRVKGRPPAAAEPAFNAICLRTCVFIWHELVGVIDTSTGTPVMSSIFIQGSRFPSHRAWVDGVQVHNVPQGPMSNLWDAATSDPTRVR